ncbi:uncharacterized protein LOC135714284 [Ochlerotatus camptorhynchus]|uniref:uncharacterized protein LOC135714284 n=1 Tax=Ochlerotatus camptorhynchus TaxID=644619 RepID=UPI0031DEAE44
MYNARYKHGRELLNDNFLKNVCFAQIADDVFQVRAYCSATMKKTQLYQVKFEICSKRQQITKSNCECVAGAGNSSACKHVAALLCCVEEFVTTGQVIQNPGCTNALQAWHKPPKNAPKDLINESIENIMSKRKQKTLRTNCAVPALEDNALCLQTTDELINITLNAGLSSTMNTNRVVNMIGN